MSARPLPASSTLAKRALQAIALTVAFYLFAIALAGLLLFIPYAQSKHPEELGPMLILWVAAGAILWSIVPRPGRFEAPVRFSRRGPIRSSSRSSTAWPAPQASHDRRRSISFQR
jgi:hypothetical protein